jgi:hypothetical protein
LKIPIKVSVIIKRKCLSLYIIGRAKKSSATSVPISDR